MTGNDRKRPHGGDSRDGGSKKKRGNKWTKGTSITGIESGVQGVFGTCDRGRERGCVGEMYGLLEDCAERLYGVKNGEEAKDSDDEDEIEDIEAALKKEMSGLQDKKREKLISAVKMDADCVIFFRLKPPLNPVEMVANLCENAQQTGFRKAKYLQRLTPISLTGKATLESIEEMAKIVLKPHFHDGQKGLKFAIRPTSRHHHVLSRDDIIKCVARCVGPDHTVDLKNYDKLIIVETYKNITGMSVVTDFEKYRRFNLRELQAAVEPAEKPDKKGKDEAKEEPKPLPQEEEQPSKPAENTEMKDTAPATEQSEEVLPTDH